MNPIWSIPINDGFALPLLRVVHAIPEGIVRRSVALCVLAIQDLRQKRFSVAVHEHDVHLAATVTPRGGGAMRVGTVGSSFVVCTLPAALGSQID